MVYKIEWSKNGISNFEMFLNSIKDTWDTLSKKFKNGYRKKRNEVILIPIDSFSPFISKYTSTIIFLAVSHRPSKHLSVFIFK